MINQWILKIQQLPKLLLGFIVIVIVMLGLYYNEPPKGICDIQMKSIEDMLAKGFYSDARTGKFRQSVKDAKLFCLTTNSPGGCHDLFKRLNFFEKRIRTLPTECGGHLSAAKMRSVIEKSLKLIAAIGWGDQPPTDKYNKVSWLDESDLGLFCRLKHQHKRLYGKAALKDFSWAVISGLPEAQTIERRQQWERSLFSFRCGSLF